VAVLLHLPLSSDKIKEKNEIGMACGKHWREEKYIQGFCGKKPLGRPIRRWNIMLKWTLRKYGRKMWT
jgi:hypothetical protein